MATAYRVYEGEGSDTSEDNTRREYGAWEADRIKGLEIARKSSLAYEGTYYFVVGGKLVRLLAAINKQYKAQGDHSLERDRVAWKWNSLREDFKVLLDTVTEEVLPLIREHKHPQFGILVIPDTEMVERLELADLHAALMELKIQVDAYNRHERTNHYIMVGLCTYRKGDDDWKSDAKVKSANAVICSFNSCLNKRPTLDLNRYLLSDEQGRPLNIKREDRWLVDQNNFRPHSDEFTLEALVALTEKLLEFLRDDDGLRCREDELTYPYRRTKKGAVKFLPRYQVCGSIPDNHLDIQVEGVDPESLYWLRTCLLDEGKDPEQVPALPTLDFEKYTFKPENKGLGAMEQLEMVVERQTRKDRRKAEKEEERRKRSQERQEQWVDMLSNFLGVHTSDDDDQQAE